MIGAVGTGIALASQNDPKKRPTKQAASIEPQTEATTPASNEPPLATAQQQQTTQEEEIPDPPANPYPEGSNIWHTFTRRAAVGLATPEGPKSDPTYCQITLGGSASQHYQAQTASLTPSQHAIVCARGASKAVIGFVESVNQDGSLTVSCTNCSGGWNVLAEKNIPAADVQKYTYLQ